MKLQAIAIDDEPPALQVISNFAGRIPELQLVKTFVSPAEALKHIRKQPVDLLFVDINMPTISGIDFVKQAEQHSLVIFTTAYSAYAVEGFNMNAVDYLLKPYTFERFSQAVQKALEYHKFRSQTRIQEDSDILYIRADYSLHRVAVMDILFIEADDDYLKIRIRGQKTLITRMTLKNILEKLPEKDFMRIHRSFIIARAHIEKIRNRTVFIAGQEIPLGNSYEDLFGQWIGLP
ncbi:MAG: response regulator transcription factor [Bacteroidia bacterium]|nr:response regulator transcription factor [Bacteroidia bacterium]